MERLSTVALRTQASLRDTSTEHLLILFLTWVVLLPCGHLSGGPFTTIRQLQFRNAALIQNSKG